jgi:hypothetical protein
MHAGGRSGDSDDGDRGCAHENRALGLSVQPHHAIQDSSFHASTLKMRMAAWEQGCCACMGAIVLRAGENPLLCSLCALPNTLTHSGISHNFLKCLAICRICRICRRISPN